jgi:hypothetical protein
MKHTLTDFTRATSPVRVLCHGRRHIRRNRRGDYASPPALLTRKGHKPVSTQTLLQRGAGASRCARNGRTLSRRQFFHGAGALAIGGLVAPPPAMAARSASVRPAPAPDPDIGLQLAIRMGLRLREILGITGRATRSHCDALARALGVKIRTDARATRPSFQPVRDGLAVAILPAGLLGSEEAEALATLLGFALFECAQEIVAEEFTPREAALLRPADSKTAAVFGRVFLGPEDSLSRVSREACRAAYAAGRARREEFGITGRPTVADIYRLRRLCGRQLRFDRPRNPDLSPAVGLCVADGDRVAVLLSRRIPTAELPERVLWGCAYQDLGLLRQLWPVLLPEGVANTTPARLAAVNSLCHDAALCYGRGWKGEPAPFGAA